MGTFLISKTAAVENIHTGAQGVSAWTLRYRALENDWWLPKDRQLFLRWMFHECWTTVRWLLQDCLITIADCFLTTNWWQMLNNQWFYRHKVHPQKCLHKIRLQLGFDLMGGYHGQPPPFALTFSPMSHEIKAQDLFMKHAPEMQIHVLDSSNASNAYITYIRVYKSY